MTMNLRDKEEKRKMNNLIQLFVIVTKICYQLMRNLMTKYAFMLS